jgi:hypothetical protein
MWKVEIPRIIDLCVMWASDYNYYYYIMFPPDDPHEPLSYVAADYMFENESSDVMLTVCPDGRVLYGYHSGE